MVDSGCLIAPNVRLGRLRLLFRWSRFALRSVRSRDFDFVANACRASARLLLATLRDLRRNVACNICGWQGGGFYPIVGPGYYETATVCPRCLCQDRHRSLVFVLERRTDFFAPQREVLEVAPMQSFQQYCLARKGNRGYRSFDLERFAMDRGDITCMHYPSDHYDYFLGFHVLEHIPAEARALAEIRRVLRPGGTAILQVPIDWSLPSTIEYEQPRPRETGHVRRYGVDFGARLAAAGFAVEAVSVCALGDEPLLQRHGLSFEPIYFARKPGG
ncbi:MAG: class I SAM-dependent methyltransferase [Planctomycetes bacterium]|jgi:hypothetical protein|nr:class I SAM-dependent methyltransferase [Planctomycetota bacterium]